MAQVRLERHEAESGYLPPVCMRCGGEATAQRCKTFKKTDPSGTAVLTWLIAPLCDSHRWHWTLRTIAVPASLVGVLFVYGATVMTVLEGQAGNDAVEWVLGLGLVCLVGWIALVIGLHRTSIRLTEVWDNALVVNGVADDFVEALEKHRQSSERGKLLMLEGADRSRRFVRLFRDDADALPEICVCCGEAAATSVPKTYPTKIRKQSSGGEVAAAILVLVLSVGHVWLVGNEQPGIPWHVALPVCERHRTYWRNRSIVIFSGFGVLLAALALVISQLDNQAMVNVFLVLLGAVIFWALVAIVIHETSLKPAEATEQNLVLRPVAEPFVAAVEEQRRRASLL
ncbi:hypothetical protein AYO44_00315 [Planctomycetaceae bacterium SCGC AG-212-F19]|nr:hypothetical protein AYO44_00315 [Planctomycetaceae bacterium SCGC AG-212-F19]